MTVTKSNKHRRFPWWAPAPMPCVVCGKPSYARGGMWVSPIGQPAWFRALLAFYKWAFFPPRPVCWDTACMRTLALKYAKLQGLGGAK